MQRGDEYFAFWGGLLGRMKERSALFSAVTPKRQNWNVAGAGRTGVAYKFFIRAHDAQVSLRIRCKNETDSKRIFDALGMHRDETDRAFGEGLEWQRLDHRRASRIRYVISLGGLRDEDQRSEIHHQMIDAMIRLEKALRPHVKAL